jgi:hypothetical protein
MSALSEVSLLIGQRAGDLEKAWDVFTAETRGYVTGILGAIQRARAEPWETGRIRVDLPREIDTEPKSTPYLSGRYAIARTSLRFKRGVKFMVVADVKFGIEYDDTSNVFFWQIVLTPASKYNRMDDYIWQLWRSAPREGMVESVHQDKTNTVRFVRRPLDMQLTPEAAFRDVKTTLEFLLQADGAIGEAVGLEPPLEEN